MTRMTEVDEGLIPYATEYERKLLDAVNRLGSQKAACEELGVLQNAASTALTRLRARAARRGYAPGHFSSGVAEGYRMGKVTVQRGPQGVERVWERQLPDDAMRALAERAALEALGEEITRALPLEAPGSCDARLLNLYTLTDTHVGMRAWAAETGADWDLKIAERTLTQCFERMVMQSPAAEVGIVNQLGDMLHFDGLLPVTPTSHHVLDADTRFSLIVKTCIRIIRRLVDLALLRHNRVLLLLAEGNHDMASSVWLRHLFATLYENEPRVIVHTGERPYYVISHGKTMLAFHHGHLKKNEQLPLLFASMFPVEWGGATKRYAHTGHRHHIEDREHSGMTVLQHPTLAAPDAHAARGGWLSERAARAITYHDEFGEVGRVMVCPEMISEAA